MSVKLYYDLFSPSSRSIYMFLKAVNVPFTAIKVDTIKGEHLKNAYKEIGKLKNLPILDYKGFKIMEKVAIMRHITKHHTIADHWYPKDSKKQALVDEYLSWQHHNTSFLCYMFYELQHLRPLLSGKPPNFDKIEPFKDRMIDCLDKIETIWLEKQPFLTGEYMTIADLCCLNDIDQTRIAGYNPKIGRPHLTAWMERVKKSLNPHYDEVFKLSSIKI